MEEHFWLDFFKGIAIGFMFCALFAFGVIGIIYFVEWILK